MFLSVQRIIGVTVLILGLVSGTARGADKQIVNVAAIPIDPSANVYYAIEQGYFDTVGLDVRVMPMTSGPAIVAAVASGAVDIGVSNVSSLAAARLHGIPIRFIAAAAVATPETRTDLIMVPKDSAVRIGSDLNGKTVAISGLKSFQQVSASAWIDKHGGDARTVKFVEVPFPEMGAAMEAHRVDAAMTTEPFSSANLATAHSLGPVLQAVAPNFMLLGWVASDTWLKAHSDIAQRYATAIRQASQWANTHRKESATILAKYTKMPPAVADAMARTTYGTELTPAMVSPALEASVRYGIIDKAMPSDDLIWRP